MCQVKKWGQPLTYDNLSKSLHTFPLGFYHSLLSFKTSGLVWPLRKSSAFFILYSRCSDSNPSNTCNKCHMSTVCCPNAIYTMGLFKIGSLIKAKDDAAFSLVPRLPAWSFLRLIWGDSCPLRIVPQAGPAVSPADKS